MGEDVEGTGETVGEAKWAALRELEQLHPGLDKSAVAFEVVSEGERGLLGIGYAPARVIASVPDDALADAELSDDASGLAADVHDLLVRIADALGVAVRVEVEEDDDVVTATYLGHDVGVLIGRHGRTIDAIQFLVSAIVGRVAVGDRKEVVVDAAGYRARRRATLEALAVRTGDRVRRSGEPVALEPMSAAERKIVHVRLHEVDGVETWSEGDEPGRYVVVGPA